MPRQRWCAAIVTSSACLDQIPPPAILKLCFGSLTRELWSRSLLQFVRVEKNSKGWRCETCPISGTIKRGANAMEGGWQRRSVRHSHDALATRAV